ncbi:hypothetical protein D3Y57_04910 (plasmid) [Sphingomonas paeninsulae]|jgi:hypothetical protein|uniref:Uncharacterized protein n=2 Tax=Sphingomonas paeninsulae TaxID=2319844 RepID=A0A494TE65_SPHPE|nr:hypothetical protein D3Y57_04910 [Sphingomonas paeninsulae]
MGILDIAEEAAGAFAADKALEAVDPNAGFLAKSVAAVAGFEGVSKVKEYMDQGDAPAADAEAPADPQSDT